MSSKRAALNQLTKDGWSRDESPRGDDEPDPVVKASADVMAKRKLAKPRARRQPAAAAESNGSAFGSIATATSSGSSAPSASSNPFASFGAAAQSTVSNPFASIGSFGSKPQTAPQTATPSASSSSPSENKKPTQLRALNEKFVENVNELLKKSGNEDWTAAVRKYLEYVEKINSGTLESPANNQTSDKPLTSEKEQEVTKPATSGFSFATQPVTAAPSGFSFGSGKPAASSVFGSGKPAASSAFSFGALSQQPEPVKAAPVEVEEDKPKKKTETVEVSDSDSDSDGPPKGPKFQLSSVPTTSDSSFAFNNTSKSSDDSAKVGFQFSGTLKKSENPFKFKNAEKKEEPAVTTSAFSFGKPTTTTEPAKSDQVSTSTPSPFSFGASKADEPKSAFSSQPASSSTWTPDKGIKFADSNSSKFTFGGSKPEEKKEIPKVPSFSFSTNKPEEKKETAKVPSFSFSTSKPAESSAKPSPFSFSGAAATPFSFSKPADSTPSDKDTTKAAFGSGGAFGQGSSLFGTKPANTSAPFSFSAPSVTPAPAAAQNDENGAEDESAAPAEPSKDFSSEKGPGEEDEDTAYEHKAKLFKLVNGKFEVQGLGQLRVLTHKQTKKTRLLLRAEGSGRVILNIPVRKEIEYKKEGKNQVRLVDFDADTKMPVTYLARVKTSDDAENLKNALETEKVKQ